MEKSSSKSRMLTKQRKRNSCMVGLEIDWGQVFYDLVQMLISYGLALPIGWNRERTARSAGLRTFPPVEAGACGCSFF
jgi:uncharacterized membrane protein YhiD involved in acid resistance